MSAGEPMSATIGKALATSRLARLAELVVVLLGPAALLFAAAPFAGGDPLKFQAFAWVANVLMMILIWIGLRLRGQSWIHLGVRFAWPDLRATLRVLAVSVVVLAAAVAAFVVGAIVAANIFGMPEGPDTSGYSYMAGNLPMLIAALAAAYVVSSFGEEVVYRGFLIE